MFNRRGSIAQSKLVGRNSSAMNGHVASQGRLIETASQGEMLETYASRQKLSEMLVDEWSRTREGALLDELYTENPATARNTALALEIQRNYLRESQYSSEFQLTPENTLRVVRVGVANSNRGRIFTEWPLVTTDDKVYFVDKTYASTLRGATANQIIYDKVAPDFGSEIENRQLGIGNGSNTTFADTLPVTPIVPFCVRVLVSEIGSAAGSGAYISNDDGSGSFNGTILDVANSTIDYSTGAISLEFNTAPIAGAVISVDFQWDSEDELNHSIWGDIELQVRKKGFNARPMPLGFYFTKMIEVTMGKSGLGNANDMLIRAIGDEHAQRRDYKAFQWGRRLALGNPVETFNTDFASAGEDNDYNHAQRVLTSISNMSTAIFDDIKRGNINVGYASGKAISYFAKNAKWVGDGSQKRVGGSFLAGKLDGIELYQCPTDPKMADTGEAIFTYKNPDEEGDIAIAFGVLTEFVAALDYPEFYRRGNVATVEDTLPIEPKFCRMLRLEGLE